MQRAQEILEKTFGYAEFRLEQAQIIGALIDTACFKIVKEPHGLVQHQLSHRLRRR